MLQKKQNNAQYDLSPNAETNLHDENHPIRLESVVPEKAANTDNA